MRLCYRFVHLFVFAYAPEEIPLGYFGRGIFVIGVPRADFECDVRSNDGWVVAEGFEEDEVDAFLFCDAGFDAGSVFNMLAGIRPQYKIALPSSASTIRRICTYRQKNPSTDRRKNYHGYQHSLHPSTTVSASRGCHEPTVPAIDWPLHSHG
jgi:hypothetical protein